MKNSEIRARRAGVESPRTEEYQPGKPTPRRNVAIVPAAPTPRPARTLRGARPGKPTPRREPSGTGPDMTAWFDHPQSGRCEACGQPGRLIAHHVVLAQKLTPEQRGDTRNRMLLGRYCDCHEMHHSHGTDRRIAYFKVSDAAVQFAVEVLGAGPAAFYFYRRYQGAPQP